MKFEERHMTQQVFSFKGKNDDGSFVWYHFAVDEIIIGIAEGKLPFEVVNVPLTQEMVDYMADCHGVEEEHLARISDERLKWPILILHEDDEGKDIIADGNHRLVKNWRMGNKEVRGFFVRKAHWLPYVLTDLPPELLAMAEADVEAQIHKADEHVAKLKAQGHA